MQGHHALCPAPAHATGRLRTAGSGARGRRHLLAALLMACGHAKTAVLVHGFHLRAPNWETVVWGGGGGRVAYGYDLAIIRAKSADGAGGDTHRFPHRPKRRRRTCSWWARARRRTRRRARPRVPSSYDACGKETPERPPTRS